MGGGSAKGFGDAIDRLEPRRFMAAGGVDTTKPFYFQPDEVPALTDWIRSHGQHHGEINDDYQLAEELTRNPALYEPGAIERDRGDNLLNLAVVYRYITDQPGAIPGADRNLVANE